MNTFTYVGSELDLFSHAHNWKQYVFSSVAPFLGQHVMEVGAGFGGSTAVFARHQAKRWLCVEPDPDLAARLQDSIETGALPKYCEVAVGTTQEIGNDSEFDTLMYLDVLEHIEDDQAEFERAATKLCVGGHLIVLCPAHQWLFTPFDEAIGHFRRYNRSMMKQLRAAQLEPVRLRYLDSVGLMASLANRTLLKQSMPTANQIKTWDRLMVPASRVVDNLVLHRLGKSILGIWKRV